MGEASRFGEDFLGSDRSSFAAVVLREATLDLDLPRRLDFRDGSLIERFEKQLDEACSILRP